MSADVSERSNAEVFDKALLAGRAEAEARVTDRQVEARVGDQVFSLPLDGLRTQLTGIDLSMLRLTHPEHPDRILVLRDLELAEVPPLSTVPSVAEALRGNRSAMRRFWGCGCSTALSVAVLIALVLLLFDNAVRWAVDRLPWSVERELGDLLVDSVHADERLVADASTLAALHKLAAPLIDDLPPEQQIDLYVVRDASLNAYALPGGHITLHTGLIERAETPEHILGVLAHEMGHVSERHSLQGMAGRLGIVAVAQLIFGDASGLVALAGEAGATLVELDFSRDLEEKADRVALQSLVEAGVDPRGLLDFFTLLSEEEGDGRLPTFLSTHPATDARRASLERALQTVSNRATRRPPEDLEELQAALAAAP
ncbi:MAG: M48 family metallopeptidase [Acidobacteriota bacterium]